MTAVLDRSSPNTPPRPDGAGGVVTHRSAAASEPASGPPRRSRLPVRRLWILPAAAVLAGALALVPAVRDDGPGPGEADVTVDGSAMVGRAGGERRSITDDAVRLRPGDSLEITGGTAHFDLARDVSFEGRAGATVGGRSGTTVRMARVPELVAGRLLVVAPQATRIEAAGTTVRVSQVGDDTGAVRLDRRLGLSVGSYRGQVVLESAGRRGEVLPLHRAEVASPGDFGRRDLPVRYSPSDDWDRRFLGDALFVDRQLQPLLQGLAASDAADLTSAAGLRTAVPGLASVATLRPLLAEVASGGEALVLAVVTEQGPGASFRKQWQAAAGFRDDGAEWGLVALDQRVDPSELLDGVRAAVDRIGLDFDPGPEPDDGVAPDAGAGPGDTPTAAPAATRPSPTAPDAPAPAAATSAAPTGAAAPGTPAPTPTTPPPGGGGAAGRGGPSVASGGAGGSASPIGVGGVPGGGGPPESGSSGGSGGGSGSGDGSGSGGGGTGGPGVGSAGGGGPVGGGGVAVPGAGGVVSGVGGVVGGVTEGTAGVVGAVVGVVDGVGGVGEAVVGGAGGVVGGLSSGAGGVVGGVVDGVGSVGAGAVGGVVEGVVGVGAGAVGGVVEGVVGVGAGAVGGAEGAVGGAGGAVVDGVVLGVGALVPGA